MAPVSNYESGPIKNIVKFLKYNKWKGLLNVMTPFIENYLNLLKYDFQNFVVVPIPLHKDRERERGFNQSKLIAEIFSKKTGAIINADVIKRVKATKTQADLKDPKERQENVKDCFEIKDLETIKNKNVVLVDDVFTTGSTIGEAATLLKKHGAKKIIAFVFAKA
ncbi:MAG: ComF family protein [Patescibacteria group bacterium]|nr:ComF family protein [Patescibacteria group bacterium]